MAADDLQRLWKLHQIDAGLTEIRAKAAALDPGRKIGAEIQAIEKQLEEAGSGRKLAAELIDLELTQKGFADKIKKIEQNLYSGKIVNPREVADFQKEIQIFKRQSGEHDARILEIYELLPEAEKTQQAAEAKIAELKKALVEHQKNVMKLKTQLEEDFKRLNAERPVVAKTIPPATLARYESIKQRHGTGMAEVVRNRSCGGCGTMLAERTLQAIKEHRPISCEECHRLLYNPSPE